MENIANLKKKALEQPLPLHDSVVLWLVAAAISHKSVLDASLWQSKIAISLNYNKPFFITDIWTWTVLLIRLMVALFCSRAPVRHDIETVGTFPFTHFSFFFLRGNGNNLKKKD